MKRFLISTMALLAALAVPAAAAQAAPTPTPAVPVPADLAATEVSFAGDGGLTLRGTVLSPRDGHGQGPRPGIVLVHGAGQGTARTKLMTEAVEFARRGMAVLVYDKRSVGYSLFERSYAQLATDALGAVAALRRRPGVNPSAVGLWGLSEGGWVVPMAAARSSDVAFAVLVGANSQQPLRQQAWAVSAGLRKAGVSGSLPDRAVPTMYRAISDGGLFPEPWHDPLPVLRKVRQPVLAIWGTHDLLTPPKESPPLMAGALAEGGNEHVTMRMFAGADHAAHRSPDGGVTRLPELTPGYPELVGSWVSDVVAGRAPLSSPPEASTRPHQESATIAVPPPSWWESAAVQCAALLLFLLAFLGYPLAAGARRIRGTAVASSAGPRVLAAAGLAVVAGGFCYLMYVIMTGGKLAEPGPVLAGRPVLWLLLQALAIAAAVAVVPTARAWRAAGRRSERVRLGLLVAAGVVMIPWALYWGLLLP
ncbi:alpha/beta hydrolase family protein [Nonomuraea sp. NPDC059194]|uniref:alpha/beta hydrolase family protein n=1 Tax=Nonomuraea sp. NPDC059194 TaxID=3346764 RepID=UPI00369BD152